MNTIKSLAKNQLYFFSEGKIVFQSYDTIVATIENYENGNEPIVTVTENQPQSRTTAKYLNQFLKLHTGVDNYKTFV